MILLFDLLVVSFCYKLKNVCVVVTYQQKKEQRTSRYQLHFFLPYLASPFITNWNAHAPSPWHDRAVSLESLISAVALTRVDNLIKSWSDIVGFDPKRY